VAFNFGRRSNYLSSGQMSFEDFMIESTAEALSADTKIICIFTKPRHVEKMVNFLNHTDLKYVITSDKQEILNFSHYFDIGVSYCCPYILPIDERPFYNYHPAPIEYKGLDVYAKAIQEGLTSWGVTLHRMTKQVDVGEIVDFMKFDIGIPYSTDELGTIAHSYLFQLFRRSIFKCV